jgi:cytochrome c-type biogenesis protein CcmH/NrfG
MAKAFAPLIFTMVVALLSSCATLRSLTPGHNSFEDGLALFNQGQFDSAIQYFRQSTFENPNSAQPYLYLGRSYISLGRWKSAIQPLRTAFRLSPHEAKDEIMNLIVDAVFATATNDPRLGESGSSAHRYKDLL